MREVTQLFTQGAGRNDGHSADGTPGDCYRAALASLLGLPAKVVPHFSLYLSWWDESRRWLQQRDLDVAYVPAKELDTCLIGHNPAAPVLICGPSPRGPFSHVVVGLTDGSVIWDPHPSRAGVLKVEEFFVLVQPYGHLPARLMLEAAA